MNFSGRKSRNDPEINLIPLIDVMLVIIIFLIMTTTFDKLGGVKLNLPSEKADAGQTVVNVVHVVVTAAGAIKISGKDIQTDVESITTALVQFKPADKNAPAPAVQINADAKAPFNVVSNVMQAARRAKLSSITFGVKQVAGS